MTAPSYNIFIQLIYIRIHQKNWNLWFFVWRNQGMSDSGKIISGIPFSGKGVRHFAAILNKDGNVLPIVVISMNPLISTPDMFVVAELYMHLTHKSPKEYLKDVIDDFLKIHPTFMEDFKQTPPRASLV